MAKAPHPNVGVEVGVRELRNRLSHYLSQVAAGTSILVTDRGKPVARLSAVDETPPGLHRLIEEGLVRLPTRPATPVKNRRRVKVEGGISDLIAEQRP